VFSFSSKLIEETIKVFREENNLELSPEQANLYLHSLAGLFLAFARPNGGGLASGIKPRRDGAVAEPAGSVLVSDKP
jgi:hypothetical protein